MTDDERNTSFIEHNETTHIHTKIQIIFNESGHHLRNILISFKGFRQVNDQNCK